MKKPSKPLTELLIQKNCFGVLHFRKRQIGVADILRKMKEDLERLPDFLKKPL